MGKAKRPKIPGYMRTILAINTKNLLDYHFSESSNKPLALAEKSGLSLSSIQRVLNVNVGSSIDSIESIAEAFDISVYQLLLPNLDVENPQVVTGASASERQLYKRFQRNERLVKAS